MIRIEWEPRNTKHLAINLRLVRVSVCCLLLVLSSGCIGGASGGAKSGLFDRFDKREESSGTAALKPVVVCPTCSVPVGVAANGSPSTVQPVPPVPGSGVTAESLSVAAANPQLATGTTSQPMQHVQSTSEIPQVPPEGAANHGAVPHTSAGARQPNVPLTWEQSQAAHLRTQLAVQEPANEVAPVNQTAPVQNMMPAQVPAQQSLCVPGTTVAKSFAGQWHDSTQAGSPGNGVGCPPTPVEADLKSCRDEMARMKSEFEQMRASQEKANEAAQALAAKQQQIELQNRELRRQYERERVEELERLKVLSEIIDEIPNEEATSDQPQPQASKRTKVPVRVASRSRVQATDGTPARRVTLPSVDE